MRETKPLPVNPINVRVAEKVFKMVPHGDLPHLWREDRPEAPFLSVDYLEYNWSSLPVVDRMVELGFIYRLDMAKVNGKLKARAKFYKTKDHGGFAESESVSEAICNAALSAIDGPVPSQV